MRPIAYVDRLNEFYRSQGFPPYRWSVNSSAPLTPLPKPLSRCRVSMLTSGGVSTKSMRSFDPMARNDLRVDPLAADTAPGFFVINDAYYSHEDADRDINCVFPIQRLHELASEGLIGEVAPNLYTGFMGRIYRRTAVVEEVAPALARRLHEERVDAFVMVPA